MRLRWPLVWRSTAEADRDALLARQNVRLGDLEGKLGLAAAERRTLEADAVRLGQEKADDAEAIRRLAADLADLREQNGFLVAELCRPLPCPVVAPFWLGLPNEILNLIVTTNMDGIQATLESTPRDDESDDPRRNMQLPFGLRPI